MDVIDSMNLQKRMDMIRATEVLLGDLANHPNDYCKTLAVLPIEPGTDQPEGQRVYAGLPVNSHIEAATGSEGEIEAFLAWRCDIAQWILDNLAEMQGDQLRKASELMAEALAVLFEQEETWATLRQTPIDLDQLEKAVMRTRS